MVGCQINQHCQVRVLSPYTWVRISCVYTLKVNDVTFLRSNPLTSNRSVLNLSNGGTRNPKLALKVNILWIKIKAENYASQAFSNHTFKIYI